MKRPNRLYVYEVESVGRSAKSYCMLAPNSAVAYRHLSELLAKSPQMIVKLQLVIQRDIKEDFVGCLYCTGDD